MACKYTTPEEDTKIMEMYRSGLCSYQQIAEQRSLSKSTVINIVKGYPYNKDKSALLQKMQEQSAILLEHCLSNTRTEAARAWRKSDFAAHGRLLNRWCVLTQLSISDSLHSDLKAARTEHEQCAWKAFAEMDYAAFSTHVDVWEALTEIIGDNMKNPWNIIVVKAHVRSRGNSLKYYHKDDPACADPETTVVSFSRLSEPSWRMISPILPITHKNRRVFEGIIYALHYCKSLRSIPEEYGHIRQMQRYFQVWYSKGVFCEALSLTGVCMELENIRPEILAIEIHRIGHGNSSVPRLSDLREMAFLKERKKHW